MVNAPLKEAVQRLLPQVQMPAQYIGGEIGSVVKDHRQVRGKLCLAFPDTYTLGMSHHGLQVLYTLMNSDPQWACERAFTPWIDFEQLLRARGLPLHSTERTLDHPLVIAGGPGAQNPEVLAPFIDVFVIGDGEESLPWLMDRWMTLKERGGMTRADMIAELVGAA